MEEIDTIGMIKRGGRMSENRKIRVFYQFNGYVQGVGFRYRMSHLAGHFGVTGWMRNEYDGSVQAELQGLPEEIDMIIQRLCQDRYIEIRSMDRKELPLDETERGFHVKY
jgi:acylphosphatase